MTNAIILDSRENKDEFISYLLDTAKTKGYEIRVEALPFGDIRYENLVIERKELNDFVSSVTSDRMWDQIYQMKSNFEISSLIMISGDYSDLWKDNKDKIPHIEGGIKRILSLGIPVLRVHTDEELVDKAFELFEYSKPLNIPVKRVDKNKKHSLFNAFPGIGPKNSKVLISEYDNMCELCEASEKELQILLGPKKGSMVYNALRE